MNESTFGFLGALISYDEAAHTATFLVYPGPETVHHGQGCTPTRLRFVRKSHTQIVVAYEEGAEGALDFNLRSGGYFTVTDGILDGFVSYDPAMTSDQRDDFDTWCGMNLEYEDRPTWLYIRE